MLCSSDDESGIVNHKVKVLARKYSGNKPDIASVVSFSLPIKSQTENNDLILCYDMSVYILLVSDRYDINRHR
jgi:hypothetical protein